MGDTGKDGEPKDWWEKLNDSAIWWFVPIMLMISTVLREGFGLGSTSAYAVMAAVAVPAMLVMALMARESRNKRMGRRAAVRGVFECWIRYPNALPDSLRRRWDFGTARLADGTLLFERQLGPDEPPSGRPTVFSQPVHLAHRTVPAPERRGMPKAWQIVALRTDRGDIEVATSTEGLEVLGRLETPQR
jgi:hypothetical protein